MMDMRKGLLYYSLYFVMLEIFHNKKEKKGRQSQKLDTKPAALVNRSDQLEMPITCPQRPLSPACRWLSWVRQRGRSVTLRAI